jgi:hypothetical protein
METSASERPGAWRVLLAFSGLAILAGIVGFLAFVRTGSVEPASVLATAFEERPLPFGFVPRFAAELPFGRKLVRFAAPETSLAAPAPPEEPAEPVGQAPKEEEGDGDAKPAEERPRIVWRKVPIAAPGAPREAALLFAGGTGKDAVRSFLDAPNWRPVDELGPEGGWAAVEAATLQWDRFEPRYVIGRKFEPPGRYVDSARVDLSAHGRWCVLFVDWEPGTTATKDALLELTRAFVPIPAPPATAAK